MKSKLKALKTKLNWNKQELEMHVASASNQAEHLYEQINNKQNQINKSNYFSDIIHPELEMQSFAMNNNFQEQIHTLHNHLQQNQELIYLLQSKLLQSKTELKILERHLKKKQMGAIS